jgi:hypothetical protein
MVHMGVVGIVGGGDETLLEEREVSKEEGEMLARMCLCNHAEIFPGGSQSVTEAFVNLVRNQKNLTKLCPLTCIDVTVWNS